MNPETPYTPRVDPPPKWARITLTDAEAAHINAELGEVVLKGGDSHQCERAADGTLFLQFHGKTVTVRAVAP